MKFYKIKNSIEEEKYVYEDSFIDYPTIMEG